jgi:predicted site-specific integrase-resolvase
VLGAHDNTLRQWANDELIPYIHTPGGKRRYDVSRFIAQQRGGTAGGAPTITKERICYCRVSSAGQKDDLQRQIDFMRQRFPDHRIISDVGYFNRKGLCSLLELACKEVVSEVVVAYRDRLCRFAFELIERVFHNHGVKLVVLNQNVESEQSSELAEDLLAIINVYACRVNGKRKYKNRKSAVAEQQQAVSQADSEQVSEGTTVP